MEPKGILTSESQKVVVYDNRKWWRPTRSKYYYADIYVDRKRRKKALHRYIYEKFSKGSIPPGYDVHHRDGNRHNNHFENLVALPAPEHHSHHLNLLWKHHRPLMLAKAAENRVKAAEWHRSEAGRRWHSEHGRQAWEDREAHRHDATCVQCGTEFVAYRGKSKYCTIACRSKYAYYNRSKVVECLECGKVTHKPPTYTGQSCSLSCASRLREARKRLQSNP